jgi:valyl-tRNA synthetase
MFEFGFMYVFKFPIEKGTDFLAVSTTRPETMLGDTAVAVHPNGIYNFL